MTLENLVRINQLKREPPDRREFEGLVNAATDRLKTQKKIFNKAAIRYIQNGSLKNILFDQ